MPGLKPRVLRWLAVAVGAYLISAGCADPPTHPQIGCEGSTYGLTRVASPPANAPVGSDVSVSVVVDCSRNGRRLAVTGAPIGWAVQAGGGSVPGNTSSTDATGLASIVWTLGAAAGANTLRAEFIDPDGLHLYETFSVKGTPPSACTGTGTQHGSVEITANETWTAAGSPHYGTVGVTSGAVLTIEPGAVVCVLSLDFYGGGRLMAVGTAGAKIRFTADPAVGWTGIRFPSIAPAPSSPSIIEQAVIEYAANAIDDGNQHPVTLRDLRIRQTQSAALLLFSAGTTVERVTVDTTLTAGTPAVHLGLNGGLTFIGRVRGAAGEGIRIANKNITLSQCEITKSGDVGIVVIAGFNSDPAIAIHGCNITDNAGVGLLYGTNPGVPLNATGNWWGDPAGPAGAAGDGVTGNVDASAPLSSPAVLPF